MAIKIEDLRDEMGSKAEMIIQSNLSDSLIEIDVDDKDVQDRAKFRINFVKFLINITNGDLSERIDLNKTMEAFLNR